MTNKDMILIMKCVNGTSITWSDWMGASMDCYMLVKTSPSFQRVKGKNYTHEDTWVYVRPKAEEAL